MNEEENEVLFIPRYSAFQRLNHWLTAICFVLLAISGLGIFYPVLWWWDDLFGGGQTARMVHPWIGCILFVSYMGLFLQFIARNFPNRDDVKWMLHIRQVMSNREESLPELGKYNAGQKGVFWAMFWLTLGLLITGIIIWDQYFYAWTVIETKRIALLVHALLAVIAISVIIVHIYAGIWVKGTMRAMTRGTVTGGWAYRHHRKWLREVLRKQVRRQARPQGH